jgi:hypothetical protein
METLFVSDVERASEAAENAGAGLSVVVMGVSSELDSG